MFVSWCFLVQILHVLGKETAIYVSFNSTMSNTKFTTCGVSPTRINFGFAFIYILCKRFADSFTKGHFMMYADNTNHI